jgi:tetratricopeptide (TPR) repeat protein
LYELPSSVASWPFAVAAVMVMLTAALLIWRGGTYRGLTAPAVAYAAILAPVLGFAQSGPQLVADRYAYVAGILFSVLLATALVLMSRRIALRWLISAGAVVLAGYGAATWHQSAVWHDSTTLWSHAIESGHASYRAHLDLGQALRADGRLDDALAQYRRAVELRPDSGNAWYVYANAMKAKGTLGEAEAAYQRAIAHSTAGSAEWLLAHVNLGNLYYMSRRLDAALGEYRAAVAELDRMPPDRVMPEPYLYLGFALIDRGDADGARRALSVAARYPSTRDRAERELRRLAQ